MVACRPSLLPLYFPALPCPHCSIRMGLQAAMARLLPLLSWPISFRINLILHASPTLSICGQGLPVGGRVLPAPRLVSACWLGPA